MLFDYDLLRIKNFIQAEIKFGVVDAFVANDEEIMIHIDANFQLLNLFGVDPSLPPILNPAFRTNEGKHDIRYPYTMKIETAKALLSASPASADLTTAAGKIADLWAVEIGRYVFLAGYAETGGDNA